MIGWLFLLLVFTTLMTSASFVGKSYGSSGQLILYLIVFPVVLYGVIRPAYRFIKTRDFSRRTSMLLSLLFIGFSIGLVLIGYLSPQLQRLGKHTKVKIQVSEDIPKTNSVIETEPGYASVQFLLIPYAKAYELTFSGGKSLLLSETHHHVMQVKAGQINILFESNLKKIEITYTFLPDTSYRLKVDFRHDPPKHWIEVTS